MTESKTVSFETAEGTKVTCSPELAKLLGYSGSASRPKKSTAKKASSKGKK